MKDKNEKKQNQKMRDILTGLKERLKNFATSRTWKDWTLYAGALVILAVILTILLVSVKASRNEAVCTPTPEPTLATGLEEVVEAISTDEPDESVVDETGSEEILTETDIADAEEAESSPAPAATPTPTASPSPTPHVHQYTTAVTKATCETQGYTTYTCACGDSYKGDYKSALGHDYKAENVAGTCTERGYTKHTCSRCGDYYIDSYTDMVPHSYQTVQTVDATCISEGYTIHKCTVCGDTYFDNYVSALGHSISSMTLVSDTANCGLHGIRTYQCAHCGFTTTESSPATGEHDWEATGETPTQDGCTVYRCTCCGETKEE